MMTTTETVGTVTDVTETAADATSAIPEPGPAVRRFRLAGHPVEAGPATHLAAERERLDALTDEVVSLLGTVAGLSAQQMLAGQRALQDELKCR